MLRFVAAATLALALASVADARPRHAPAASHSFFESLFHSQPERTAPTHRRSRRGHRDRVGVDRGEVHGGRPAACRGIAWCGCWLRLHLGVGDARLNLARAWASIGEAASGPAAGVVAVWPHHVGLITENLGGGMIRLLSGNDGNAVRERVRSTRGIIAYRKV